MTMIAVVAVFLGWTMLALSSRRMGELLPARLRTASRALQIAGMSAQCLALALFVRAQGWSFGSVYFTAWWMLGGLAVVLAMTWRLERAGMIRK
jgi:fatty acid desaturase